MEAYSNEGKKLPFPGGFDKEGRITDDPSDILESWRTMPIGYWKGASLSLLLDLLATILSGGSSVNQITERNAEFNVSQVFIVIDLKKLDNESLISQSVQNIIDDLHSSIPSEPGGRIRYPGEDIETIRNENMERGIPVARNIWDEILSL
jgi:3-dehydro-L-gulonate 2-dehydrogenase